MRPLRVALVHRGNPRRYARIDGQFAYPVPEFVWEHVEVHKSGQNLDINKWQGKYDLVWLDPGKYSYLNILSPKAEKHKVKSVYWALFPTLTQGHLNKDQARAKWNANLVLLDHDNVNRWEGLGVPVRRLAYSVNERYYYDRGLERDIDVNFACYREYSHERPALDAWLRGYCERRGWSYASGSGYTSEDYALVMARSKVMVHILRTPLTRPPRMFDTAACGTAMLSNPMPVVSGEHFDPGTMYRVFNKPFSEVCANDRNPAQVALDDDVCSEIITQLDYLLTGDNWRGVAETAKEYVLANHTWATRSAELRQIVREEFKI